MNKGLEALKEIVDYAINEFTDNEKKYQKDLDIIEKKLKSLEIISKAYGDYANHKISEYELIMIVGENTTY